MPCSAICSGEYWKTTFLPNSLQAADDTHELISSTSVVGFFICSLPSTNQASKGQLCQLDKNKDNLMYPPVQLTWAKVILPPSFP